MSRAVRLQVNVDHVATVRQARRAPYPDPVELARLAEEAGATGITVHLREDRRHIQDADVRALRRSVRGRLNLEMAAREEMLAIALEVQPHQVSLVPERPEEVTTEGGLDVCAHLGEIEEAARRLRAAGIDVSVFVDPEAAQIAALAALRPLVHGFEINTDRYTRAPASAVAAELDEVRQAAAQGAALGFEVYAGHGLTTANVGPIAAIPVIEELNIGHWLVSRALAVGMPAAVGEMLAAMAG